MVSAVKKSHWGLVPLDPGTCDHCRLTSNHRYMLDGTAVCIACLEELAADIRTLLDRTHPRENETIP